MFEKGLNDFEMPFLRRYMQWGPLRPVLGIRIGALLEKKLSNF
jgi:hypothetical protein